MRIFCTTLITALLALAAFFSLDGCTVTTQECLRVTIDPTPRYGVISDPDCVPTSLGPILFRGRWYELIDADCDGRPDYARDSETGALYRVTPAPGGSGELESLPDFDPDPGDDDSLTDALVMAAAASAGATGAFVPDVPHQPDFTIAMHTAFADGFDFDFRGASAAEWLADYGLDSEPGATATITAIEITVDTKTTETELYLPFATHLEMPDPVAYGVRFGAVGLIDDTGPGFLLLRLGGPAVNVAGYLTALSSNGHAFVELMDEDEHVWTIDADATSGLATLRRDGRLYLDALLDLPSEVMP